jgi:phenylalanyl-tRNA synthetase beta chain
MEAATWNGPNIQRTSTRLGLRTEASGRFEKQLQPEQGLEGQAVAARLMGELCGARAVGGTIDVGGPGPEPRTLRLRDARTERLLGTAVPRADAAAILAGLGFGCAQAEGGLDVTVPHWRRGDVEREADLVEEVARLWGLERLPVTLPSRRGASGRLRTAQRLRRRAEDALVGAGLSEAVGWSFTAPEVAARLRLGDAARARRAREPDVRGPVGHADHAARLAAGLAQAQPLARVRATCACSSTARSTRTPGAERRARPGNPWYPVADPELPSERTRLGALLTGRARPASWATRAAARRTSSPPRACWRR